MFHFRSAALALAAAAAALAAPAAVQAAPTIESLPTAATEQGTPTICPKVMVVVARGTDEPGNQSPGLDSKYGPNNSLSGPDSPNGVWYRIAKELYTPATTTETPILTTASQILRVDLTYPAILDFPNSVPMGTVNLMTYLDNTNIACPNTEFVLLGYSQGALVIGNAIAVPSKRIPWYDGEYGTRVMRISTFNRIAAVGLQANPAFNPGHGRTQYSTTLLTAGYAKDTFAINRIDMNDSNYDINRFGVTPRDLTGYAVKTAPTKAEAPQGYKLPWVVAGGLWEDVGLKVRDYCKVNDYICQYGSTVDTTVHNTYWADIPAKRTLAVHAIKRLRVHFGIDAPYTQPYT